MSDNTYPVIDLFAGPGGLGEGFVSLRQPRNRNGYAFKIAISIEKDAYAHRTLQLRHFFREFQTEPVPDDYYHYLEGNISLDDLYLRYPQEASRAQQTAWLCTLGEESHPVVKQRISQAIGKHRKWVLVGGPPCQAYSRAGRSRMKHNPEFESDPRHLLYKQYLQILADHKPPVFIMENVEGLLSAKLQGDYVINHILQDLTNPELAIYQNDTGFGYKLYSLSETGLKTPDTDPSAFVVRAEDYGIPQARHRIFIVGIRNDIDVYPAMLEKAAPCSVRDVIGNMPPLRSSISKQIDSEELWKQALDSIKDQPWFAESKKNGSAKLCELAEEALQTIRSQKLENSDRTYSAPKVLQDWFSDDRLTVMLSHKARPHMASDLHRYFFAALYAEIHHISPRLSKFPDGLLPNHKNVVIARDGSMFSDRFRVQLPDAPATTVTSHIAKDGHYFIHYDPTQCRSLTVREAARIQTFPDNYHFEGPRTSQYQQIGNAVPPLLANKIAKIIYEVLEAVN